jgi:hypothetical protein
MADSDNSDDEIVTGKGKGRAQARWENLATNTHGPVDSADGKKVVLGVEEANKRRR